MKRRDFNSQSRLIIFNVYKYIKELLISKPDATIKEIFSKTQKVTSEACGVSLRTLQRICEEAESSKCSVRGCQSGYSQNRKENVSVFPLPKDVELRKRWLMSIPTGLYAVRHPVVCENHFLVEDIIRSPKVEGKEHCQRPLLRESSVPSVFSIPPSDPDTKQSDEGGTPLQFSAEEDRKPIVDPMQTHSNAKDLQQCISVNKDEIQRNSQKHPYQCEHCSKTFTHWGYLNVHLLSHSDEKRRKCEHCDKTFIDKTKLTIHLRTHTGEKRYKCEHCDKTFIDKTKLTIHLRTHTGEKPYQCEHCDKTFSRIGNLKVHLLSHSDKKHHKCEHCHKTFLRKGSLETHLRMHSGRPPHQCESCKKTFLFKSSLDEHLRFHSGETSGVRVLQ